MSVKNLLDGFKKSNDRLIRINHISIDLLKSVGLNGIKYSVLCDSRKNEIEFINSIGDVIGLVLDDNFESIKSIYTRNMFNDFEPVDITPTSDCILLSDLNAVISVYLANFKDTPIDNVVNIWYNKFRFGR